MKKVAVNFQNHLFENFVKQRVRKLKNIVLRKTRLKKIYPEAPEEELLTLTAHHNRTRQNFDITF